MKKTKCIPKKGNGLERRAEKLMSKKGEEIQKIPIEHGDKLVHELQVHQIELEMQNDERCKG